MRAAAECVRLHRATSRGRGSDLLESGHGLDEGEAAPELFGRLGVGRGDLLAQRDNVGGTSRRQRNDARAVGDDQIAGRDRHPVDGDRDADLVDAEARAAWALCVLSALNGR